MLQHRKALPQARGDRQNRAYVRLLAATLADEVSEASRWCPPAADLAEPVGRFARWVEALDLDQRLDHWTGALERYEELGLALAAALNLTASIARSYDSMEAFWSDAQAQSTGASPFTFWDSYEHGRRRRIESRIAGVYGSEDALLLNAGMSALTVAIESADLKPGDRIVTGLKSYFETCEYVEDHLSVRGVELVRAPIDDPRAMLEAVLRAAPRAVLFETCTNGPEAQVPRGLSAWLRAAPDALFVCDNTVQGPLTRWFGDPELKALLPDRFLAVESATKYISRSVMAGIAYGPGGSIARARKLARVTGQQLQEKAFNHLRDGDLLHAERRLVLHSRNARLIGDHVSQRADGRFEIRRPDRPRKTMDGPDLFARGVGGLLFLVPRPGAGSGAAAACRQLLAAWQRELAGAGCSLPVRAGFGWNGTSARIYESGALNQRDAPTYLRVAVGIEPEPLIRHFADALDRALEQVQ